MISYANQYSIQAAGKDDHVNASQLNDMVGAYRYVERDWTNPFVLDVCHHF